MAKPLSQIIKEADELIDRGISKKASNKAPQYNDAFVETLAKSLIENETSKEASAPEVMDSGEQVLTVLEKVAGAVAILDTLANLETLQKIAAFEERAVAAGHTPSEIETILEKNASNLVIHSLAADLFS